jgi:hypothetical protein
MQWFADRCWQSADDKACQKKPNIVLQKPVASFTIVMTKPSSDEQWALPPRMLKRCAGYTSFPAVKQRYDALR